MRYLGLDLGSKTLGVAISDTSLVIASVLTTLRFPDEDYDLLLPPLREILFSNKIEKIILGYPLNMIINTKFKSTGIVPLSNIIQNTIYIYANSHHYSPLLFLPIVT